MGSISDATSRPAYERLSRRIARVLRHASVPRPVWHLSPGERWSLLRDTLLGHAPIRGGLRPRDLPFDAYCRAAIATAARVHALPAYDVGDAEQRSMRFIDWLVVYAALVAERSGHPDLDADVLARDAVYDCMYELRRALGFDSSCVPLAECPFIHRMIGLLGLSQQEWERSDGRGGASELWMNRDDARLAVIQANAFSACDATLRLSGSERAWLPRISEPRFRLLTVRMREVQDYIDRGKRHWLMRGASAWCSQALALTRDLVVGDDNDGAAPILLSDSDAIFAILAPEALTVEILTARLEERLRDFWSGARMSGLGCDRRFPRLKEWRRAAEASGVDPTGVMPVIGIQSSRPMAAVDLCTGRFSRFKALEEGTIDLRAVQPSLPACDVVLGDVGITERSPAWLRDVGTQSAATTGWTGIVWSLCGTTFRTHCHEGLAAQLGMQNLRIVPVNQGDWLRMLSMSDEPLTYVKIDGDSIGRRFRRSPIPRLPALGLTLANNVFHRLVAAASAIGRMRTNQAIPSCLPIDIVYLGGDDLLCCIPRVVLPTVLDAFGALSWRDRSWKAISFTFVAIELPGRCDLVRGADRSGLTAMAAAATRAVGAALDYAKSITKNEVARRDAREQKLRDTLAAAGAAVQSIGEIETHGCVRGMRIRIQPHWATSKGPCR